MMQTKAYESAWKMFDSMLPLLAEDSLLKFQIPQRIFNACLCIIALNDTARLSKALVTYADLYPSFTSSSEYSFFISLLDAIEKHDLESYQQLMNSYLKYHTSLEGYQIEILRGKEKELCSDQTPDLR
jgi:hypothetical protein